MPIKVACDLCGKTVGTVPLKDIRGWVKDHGERCNECKAKVEHLNQLIIKKTDALMKQVGAFKANFFTEVEKEIAKIRETTP